MARQRCLKICCIITAATLLIIFTVVVLTLSLTIFKPKQPSITAHPAGLENVESSRTFPENITLDVTLKAVAVTIDSPNYGGFENKNSMAYINYRDDLIAEALIARKFVAARGKVNITTTTDLSADKLISNPSFLGDLGMGWLNLTSTATLHGKVIVRKILKLHATAFSTKMRYLDLYLDPGHQIKMQFKCKFMNFLF